MASRRSARPGCAIGSDAGEPITLIDVREPHEWDIANLGDRGARLIPLGELPDRLSELSDAGEIVVHCRTGSRSARAVKLLQEAGFQRVLHLRGGIHAWADEVDPTLPKY